MLLVLPKPVFLEFLLFCYWDICFQESIYSGGVRVRLLGTFSFFLKKNLPYNYGSDLSLHKERLQERAEAKTLQSCYPDITTVEYSCFFLQVLKP